jgi:serine/threonine-protein kinase RsbW
MSHNPGAMTVPDSKDNEIEAGSNRIELDSAKLILRLNLMVSGSKNSVTPAVERIMAIARDMKCASGKESEIELAIQEALANAVVHGCKEDPKKSVRITVACDEERGMIIMVRDPGAGFDPSDVPSPLMGENIYASHGRGIYLINELMDEVRYQRGGTEIWMRKG